MTHSGRRADVLLRRGGPGWPRVSLVGAALASAAVAGAVVLGAGSPPVAEAHTFLVRTEPAEGARLDVAPSELSLEFSEPFDGQGARLALTVDGQDEPLVAEQALGGRVLRADVATRQKGVWVVSWEVVAFDGHQTSGEYAFGVGDTAGDLPATRADSPPPSVAKTLAGGVFFAGLAVAAGSLAAAWTRASRLRPTLLRAGLVGAGVGAGAAWLEALAGDEPARQVVSLAVAAGVLVVALPLSRLPRIWPVALAVAGAAVAWSARGHSAVANGLGGWLVDAVHLAATTTWLGALAVLVIDLHTERGQVGWAAVVRRYARLAAVLVGVLAVAGLTAAVMLLDRLSDLWATGYGQMLSVKVALVAGALVMATVGRQALRRGRLGLLRRSAPIEAGLLATTLVLTAVLVNLTPPAATRPAEASLLGPQSLTGPVVRDAGMAGHLTVTVAATGEQLRVEIFAPGEQPENAEVDIEATFPDGDEATLLPRPCGPGCFTQRIALPDGTTQLSVTVSADAWAGGTHHTELEMPPPRDDPTLLTDLIERMMAEPVVEFTETTTSGPGSNATPGTFTLSGADYVELAPWAAGTADEIQPLPDEAGFRMYLPGEPLWVTIWTDDEGRIARERIITGRHEIQRDDFRYPQP